MAQYIDKNALVAEIERKWNICKKVVLDLITKENKDYYQGKAEAYKEILDLLDTLEVKEVDLEKDNLTWEDMLIIHKCIKDAMNKYLYDFQTVEGQQKIYKEVLKRFKAQKGE